MAHTTTKRSGEKRPRVGVAGQVCLDRGHCHTWLFAQITANQENSYPR